MFMFKNNRKTTRGLSLVELLIAVTIIAILAAIATMNFSSTVGSAQLQHATDRLISDLNLVRVQALKDKATYRLEIDTATVSYQATGVQDLHRPADINVELDEAPYQISAMTCNFGGDQFVEFDAMGKSDKMGTITLKQDRRQTTIQIQDGYDKIVQQ